jgi:uncharacterized HAD superfamily protein
VKKPRAAHDVLVRLERELSARLDKSLRIETSEPPSDAPFKEFLMAEYNNISQAHFNTVESLANFIKHYLLIASAPIFLIVLFADLRNVEAKQISAIFAINPLLAAAIGTALFLMGLCLLGYAINIRCDTLLYARAVNGIRKYFYSLAELSVQDELELRVLPKAIRRPAYYEPSYFIFVVLMFGCIGTAYISVGWYFYWQVEGVESDARAILVATAAVISHLALYYFLTTHREGGYLRQNIIGVDVDGVLNDHRTQFATFLHQRCGKTIDPDAITRIPVHEIPGTQVTEADEHAIFNAVEYWDRMPPCQPEAAGPLKKIRNALGFRVWIFTHRPWPDSTNTPANKASEYWGAWVDKSLWPSKGLLMLFERTNRWLADRQLPTFWADSPIRSVTQRWLRLSGIPFDKLVVERGNTNTPDPRTHTRNRFVMTRDYRVRVFVEDDLSKARKLANICEVVFLIDHPYNQCEPSSLPSNILRVKSWQQIYQSVRTLF